MSAPENKGKTLWEMLMERLRRDGNGNGATLSFYNPLALRIGALVPIAYANGPEFAAYDFTVQEIREYGRRISGQDFTFTDYVLRGVNKKTFDADQVFSARLRAVPNQAGGHDTLLLRVYDEFAFSDNFLGVLKDPSGIFDVTEDKTGATAAFTRLNDVRDSYEAAVLVIGETTADGKAPPGKTSTVKLEYWDYWRDLPIGAGKTGKEFVFVELNSQSGWFQIWRGREFFS